MISNLGNNIEKWFKESKEEGKEEGQKEKAMDVAKRLLDKGMEKEEIAEITGLSVSEITKLASN